MKTIHFLTYPLAIACAALFLVSCATEKSAVQTAGNNVLYVCGCGADCKCTTVKTTAGKCGCGQALQPVHLAKLEGDTALVCACGPNCKCTIDAKDATKCGCGKPIRKVSLKSTGLYLCNCGGSCCTMVSEKPGQCKCGKELKQAL